MEAEIHQRFQPDGIVHPGAQILRMAGDPQAGQADPQDGNRHLGKSGGLRRGSGKPEHAEESLYNLLSARQQPCRHPERGARDGAVQDDLRYCLPGGYDPPHGR